MSEVIVLSSTVKMENLKNKVDLHALANKSESERKVHGAVPSKVLKQQWEENTEENRRRVGKNER